MRKILSAICILAFAAQVVAQDKVKKPADPPKDGIYYVHAKGVGPKIVRNDTGETMILGELITAQMGKPSIVSEANSNTHFRLQLREAGPFPVGEFEASVAIVIDGRCFVTNSRSGPNPDNTRWIGANLVGVDVAAAIGKHTGVEPKLRKHPGHQFHVTFEPDKKKYAPGDEMTLKMTIKNVGMNTLTFFDGGRQRGPRDNQFGFIAMRGYGGGKAVPDTGDPTNFGGIGSYRTLKPGETFKKDVRLDKWFHFEDADTYQITGTYILEFHDSADKEWRTIWNDFAVGRCLVTVEAPEKK